MGKLKDMKKKFEEHCGEYRLSGQDGLFIDWQMDFFDKYYIPISEVEEIKKECSDVSMMIEVSLGYMKPETKAYYHLELAQKMLSKIWFPHKTNKEEVAG